MDYNYDLFVIGAGPGGYEAAIRASQLGLKTAIAERRDVGGTCLNRGCIPTKTMMHSSDLYAETAHFAELGLNAENITVDIAKVQQRKQDVVTKLRGGIEQLLKGNKIEHFRASAMILAPHRVKLTPVTGEEAYEVTSKYILIATGSVPSFPPVEGLDTPNVISSDELLDMDTLYDNLIIAGAGVVGMEFASLYNAWGKDVTVMELCDKILPNVDKEISQNLSMILKKRGVKIHTKTMLVKVTPEENGSVRCWYKDGEEVKSIVGDALLVASGRAPNTKGLFADDLSIEMNNKKMIIVDSEFRTSLEDVFAIGDVIPTKQLAHLASAEGLNAVEIMAGHKPAIDLSIVPDAIYTNPEIACTGLTEAEAKDKGLNISTAKASMMSNGKSIISLQDRGFIKIVYDNDNDCIVGAQLMCARATDIVNEFSTAIVNKLSKAQMQAVIRPHPTFAEAVTEAVEELDGRSIHTLHRI
ncbi:MAG: dihydrolipoyl dehydrogenase [Synergistaceae bacterium]